MSFESHSKSTIFFFFRLRRNFSNLPNTTVCVKFQHFFLCQINSISTLYQILPFFFSSRSCLGTMISYSKHDIDNDTLKIFNAHRKI